jgi:stage II sporulation protein D
VNTGKHLKVVIALSVIQSVAAANKIVVRGVNFNYPMDIKVRVAEYSPLQKFPLLIGRQNFDCAYQRVMPGSLARSMDLLPVGDEWSCRNSHNNSVLSLNSGLFLRANDEKVMIDGRNYAGKLRFQALGDRILAINEIDLDRYLAGVVNREMNSSFPEEAMKAQIIAARSYALASLADRKRASQGVFLYNSEVDQVYEGVDFESSKSRRLVKETLGQVLFQDSDVLKAYYHASSGGSLEIPSNVWSRNEGKVEAAAYEVKEIPEESEELHSKWSITLSPLMGLRWENLGKIQDIKIVEKSASQRVKKLFIKGEYAKIIVSGADFRKKLGNRWLKSTLFEIQKKKNSWLIEGRGYGHGVGMSQMGARRMAERGAKVLEILNFYYPKSSVGDVRVGASKVDGLAPQLTALLN